MNVAKRARGIEVVGRRQPRRKPNDAESARNKLKTMYATKLGTIVDPASKREDK
jgi:hypothetical protein